jgi:hypothetical protein
MVKALDAPLSIHDDNQGVGCLDDGFGQPIFHIHLFRHDISL